MFGRKLSRGYHTEQPKNIRHTRWENLKKVPDISTIAIEEQKPYLYVCDKCGKKWEAESFDFCPACDVTRKGTVKTK